MRHGTEGVKRGVSTMMCKLKLPDAARYVDSFGREIAWACVRLTACLVGEKREDKA